MDRDDDILDDLVSHPVEKDVMELVRYDPTDWKGKLPREHLREWCIQNEVEEATIQTTKVKDDEYSCSALLHHLEIQITPVHTFEDPQVAQENAALLAAVYLVGGAVPPTCLSPIPPPAISMLDSLPLEEATGVARVEIEKEMMDLEERKAEELREYERKITILDKKLESLRELANTIKDGGDPALAALDEVKTRIKNKAKKMFGSKRMRTTPEVFSGKNPVQELKELCDKHKWQQPRFQTLTIQSSVGQKRYLCTSNMPALGDECIQSDPLSTLKLAKASAAMSWLSYMDIRQPSPSHWKLWSTQ